MVTMCGNHNYGLAWQNFQMNESLADRIKRLRKAKGISQQALADAIGVSRVAVTKWESGNTKDLKRTNLIGLAKVFTVTLEHLLGESSTTTEEKGIKKISQVINIDDYFSRSSGDDLSLSHANTTQSGRERNRVPLISYVQAGSWREVIDTFQPGDAEKFLFTDVDVSKTSFALTVVGDSMLPDFKTGDIIIVDPEVVPLPGDFVVARNSENEATFKKYRSRGFTEQGKEIIELIPLNENYPSLRSDISPIEIVGKVVEVRKKL